MKDLTFPMRVILDLEMGLAELEGVPHIGPASLPPRTRFALAKVGQKVVAAVEKYRKDQRVMLESHARRDDKGKPIKEDLGGGRVKYLAEDEDALKADEQALLDAEITLTHVRMVTHAELAKFPVPLKAERLLLGHLIEDSEPAESLG